MNDNNEAEDQVEARGIVGQALRVAKPYVGLGYLLSSALHPLRQQVDAVQVAGLRSVTQEVPQHRAVTTTDVQHAPSGQGQQAGVSQKVEEGALPRLVDEEVGRLGVLVA